MRKFFVIFAFFSFLFSTQLVYAIDAPSALLEVSKTFNSIDFQFTDNVNFTINIHYRYDNEPHGNMKKTYFQIKNGFELSF